MNLSMRHRVAQIAAMGLILATEAPFYEAPQDQSHPAKPTPDNEAAVAQIRADRARRKAEQFEKQKKGKGLK